ncbi:MAG: hypothetical protein ACFE7E_06530 [Candidatus Hodarchaeota archaeon]
MVIEIIKEIKKTEEEAQKIVDDAQEKVKGERAEWDDAKLTLEKEIGSEVSIKIEEITKDAQKAIDSEIKRLAKRTDKEIEELEEIAQKNMKKAVDKIIEFILTERS